MKTFVHLCSYLAVIGLCERDRLYSLWRKFWRSKCIKLDWYLAVPYVRII